MIWASSQIPVLSEHDPLFHLGKKKNPPKRWRFKGQIENWRGKRGKSKIGDYATYMQSAYHHETSHLRFNSRDILLQDNYFSSPTERKTRTSFALTGAVYAM